ncbi:MAG: hypothetical protein WDO73_05390 [Ignavibacteriota bacterium]
MPSHIGGAADRPGLREEDCSLPLLGAGDDTVIGLMPLHIGGMRRIVRATCGGLLAPKERLQAVTRGNHSMARYRSDAIPHRRSGGSSSAT